MKIAVIGLGKVGLLVAKLLHQQYKVTGFDKNHQSFKEEFTVKDIQIDNSKILTHTLSKFHAVVSCLPYQHNLPIALAAHKAQIHYFDLTEDTATSKALKKLAKKTTKIIAPQCGLAPGFISIVGKYLFDKFSKVRDLELRVGALPQHPNGLMGYAFNWSPAGVINEYLQDATIIENGEKKSTPSLTNLEVLTINGVEYEAFTTSGGLGSLCTTLKNKVDTLNYKTIRYKGHAKLMRFLLHELLLKNKPQLVENLLIDAKPPVNEDIVLVYACAEGWQTNKLYREEFVYGFTPQKIEDKIYRAISWTTAASVCAVIELIFSNTISFSHGYLKQENIPLEQFLETSYGKLYKNQMQSWIH